MKRAHQSNRIVTQSGRRVKGESADSGTRSRLLAAALRLISERGYDGVAVDDIVREAGVNKRMVYHYFGNKEGLCGEVLRFVYGELEAIEERLFARRGHGGYGGDPAAALGRTVKSYFRFLAEHPAFVRLLQWENLAEGRHLALMRTPVTKSPMLDHLSDLLKVGERDGVFRRGLDARSVLASLIGLCLVHFSNRHTLSATLGVDLGGKAWLRRAAADTELLLLDGIRARPAKKSDCPARGSARK
jgi:AcrR family transcriptional regulator